MHFARRNRENGRENGVDFLGQGREPRLIPASMLRDSGSYHTGVSERIRISMHGAAKGLLRGSAHRHGYVFAFSAGQLDLSYCTNGSNGAIKDVGAVVIPRNTPFEIRHRGVLYMASVSVRELHEELSSPVGFTHRNVLQHLSGFRPNKIVAPKRFEGEISPEGGERIDAQERKYIIVGGSNQEFSAGNSNSPQDFHAHTASDEIFVPLSRMSMHYYVRGRQQTLHVEPGSMVIVPKMVPHFTEMHGEDPTFVVKGGSEPILNDKVIIPEGVRRLKRSA